MNDNLKPLGARFKRRTWVKALTVAELVALRHRSRFDRDDVGWGVADEIGRQIHEITVAWERKSDAEHR